MLNWLRGKFGKRNNTKQTNLTISDDDKIIELVTLANKQEDLSIDEDNDPATFQSPQDLALFLNGAKSLENVFNEAVTTPITPEVDEPSQSTAELSGNLESARDLAASAIIDSKESILRVELASNILVLSPTSREIYKSLIVKDSKTGEIIHQPTKEEVDAEYQKSNSEFDKYKDRILSVVKSMLEGLDDIKAANFVTESLNRQGNINELTLGVCRQEAIGKGNYEAANFVGQMLYNLGDTHNAGATDNYIE
jgi:hypothetical protein